MGRTELICTPEILPLHRNISPNQPRGKHTPFPSFRGCSRRRGATELRFSAEYCLWVRELMQEYSAFSPEYGFFDADIFVRLHRTHIFTPSHTITIFYRRSLVMSMQFFIKIRRSSFYAAAGKSICSSSETVITRKPKPTIPPSTIVGICTTVVNPASREYEKSAPVKPLSDFFKVRICFRYILGFACGTFRNICRFVP